VESPAFQDLNGRRTDAPAIHAESSDPAESEPIQELLVDQLRDILHAEKQLLKALPKMAKAARSSQLQTLMHTHLQETETQVERLNESLKMLGAPARAKPCKGMAGLIEEGEEVMTEGKRKDDAPADLALIGAAQRVEHYEIAAYTTARNLALQLRQPAIVQLLTMSLGEEQNAGQLLDQVAQPLMSVAKMPASVE
jgi:Mn-containing catalase